MEIADKVRAAETKAQAEYLTKVHQVRESALKNLVVERLLMEEAKKQSVEIEEYVRKEAEKAHQPATDARLRELYNELVPPGGPAFEEIKIQLAQRLAQQDAQQAMGALMERVIKQHDVKWQLKMPALPKVDVKADDDPVLGDAKAPVEVIEFSDFQCPYCAKVASVLHALVAKYPGKVKVVFRDFPLSFHENARPAAMAATCAHEQGKFWAMHDQLFKNQGQLEMKALKTYARVAGLNGEKFDECLASAKYDAEITKDLKDGEAAGVEGTPSFFVNGRPFSGSPSLEELSQAVDAALAEAG
jgi:protein-disulfide isomerase